MALTPFVLLVAASAVAASVACSGASRPPRTGMIAQSEFITVVAGGTGDERRLRLDPAPGARINALLPPVLTLESGARLTFANDSLTADSSYFTGHPSAAIGDAPDRQATLQVSVCPAGKRVCLSVELPIALR